jgi:ferredoxin
MSVVISRLCRDCVDGACVDVCPVDCIVQEKPDAGLGLPNQLFINPDDCIDCGCCEPACPWEAIFEDCNVPTEFEADIALNAITVERPEAFHVPVTRLSKKPSFVEVEENRLKWTEPQSVAT